MTGKPILTVAEMVAAEAATMAGGVSVNTLMERAGKAVAEIAWRVAGKTARKAWPGQVEPIARVQGADLVIDAVFGTGLVRPLADALVQVLTTLVTEAKHSIAVDLPSGVATDDGALLSPVPNFDLTIALGALKPAHLLLPAASHMGQVIVEDIGITCDSAVFALAKPKLVEPDPDAHKYSRGYVLVAGGAMAGAASLCADAAIRGGAGYVALVGPDYGEGPLALVHRHAADPRTLEELLADPRVDVAAIGPGLGLTEKARARLDAVLASRCRLVLDADALTLIAKQGADSLRSLPHMPVLTPHQGEFNRLFGDGEGSKVDRALAAASLSGSVVVFKGNDTVVAAPDGRAAISPSGPAWLATAGTGDVLTGLIAARYAAGAAAFEGACEAVWLHSEAARLAGKYLIADDLLTELPVAMARCH
jgi:hydroxyethylthiazole kinase-like uncharacterized protein yjeF